MIKKLLILSLSVFMFLSFKVHSFAAWGDDALLGRSSFTRTNDSLQAIIPSTFSVLIYSTNTIQNVMRGAMFDQVIIGSASTQGTISVFDSYQTQTSTLCILSMSGTSIGATAIPFGIRLSSGLTYTVSNGNGAGVTIIYRILLPLN